MPARQTHRLLRRFGRWQLPLGAGALVVIVAFSLGSLNLGSEYMALEMHEEAIRVYLSALQAAALRQLDPALAMDLAGSLRRAGLPEAPQGRRPPRRVSRYSGCGRSHYRTRLSFTLALPTGVSIRQK